MTGPTNAGPTNDDPTTDGPTMQPADRVTRIDVDAVVPGLSAAVDVWRDPWGVPHIRATTTDDAFAALGYVHAQDRLFQMDSLRRRAAGRWAEWLGPSAVPADQLARRMNAAGASQRDAAIANAETRAMLDAYARGVNAFIAAGCLPVEYALLQATAEPWEPWHSIAAMRQIGFLMGSVWPKLWRAAALPVVGEELVTTLRHDSNSPGLLCIPPGTTGIQAAAALALLRPSIEALLTQSAPDTVGGGSNNWAVAPWRTATGRPLLAGDPHRQLEMPNLYSQTHLACDAFDVIGLTVAGVPGFPHYGHTESVAWCVTHAFMDIHDLYIERFDADASHVRTGETSQGKPWQPVVHRPERIKVRGAPDVEIVAIDTHHGPVIVGDPKDGHAITLRSMQFDPPDVSFDCMIPMLRATNVASLFEATRGWGLIDHNLVAGDTAGQIGHLVRAIVPRRGPENGWLPVPGWTGAHEWNGVVAWEEMPRCDDPAGGIIVTANNRVAADGPTYLSTDVLPPYRAQRVWDRLAALAKPDIDDMQAIHNDRVSIPAQELKRRLATLDLAGEAAALRDRLVAWDATIDPLSTAASDYMAVRAALARLAARHSGLDAVASARIAAVPPGISPVAQLWWMLPDLLRRDDARLLRGASWDGLLIEALREAAAMPAMPWAEIHTPRIVHPLSALFPDAALDPASAPIGGDNDTVFATGYAPAAGPRAVYASLCRYTFDIGAWERSRWVVFHGASGQPGSTFYDNQNALWARGEMVPMLYDWPTIARRAVAHQHLR